MNDATIQLQVQLDDSKANSSLDNLNKKSESLQKAFSSAGKALTVGLTVPIAGLITAGVAYNSKVETLTTSFKVMTGSAEEAVDIVSQLKEIGAKTPYEFTGLAETVQLLMQYGQTSKQAIKVTKMVGDVSQGSAEKMNSIALAYGQMSSAGKVNLMDVKQMITAGFNPLQIISDKTGESMSSMYDRISKGTMSVQEITDAFAYATSEGGKFYGSSEEQSKTLAGRLSTLKDNFNEATGSLTESLVPALESLVDKLTKAASWFAGLDENQRKTILTILGIIAAVGPLLLIIGSVLKFIQLLSIASTILNVSMLPMILTIGAIVLGITLLVLAIIWVVKHFEKIKEVAGKVWTAIKGFFGGIGEWFKEKFDVVWKVIKNVFTKIGTFIASVFKGVVNVYITMINFILNGLNFLIKSFLAPFNLIIKGLNKVPGVDIPLLSFAIPKIPKLKIGTDLVNQEGLAYLHKGESVQPASVASGGYSNRTITLNIEMGDINMDGNKVGRAITPYVTKTVKLSGGNI